MSERIKVTVIDPAFRIPRGAEDDFVYTDTPLDTEDFDTSIFNDDMVDPPPVSGITTPDTFTIVNQTIKRAKGDAQSVDIVFETDTIPGAIKYEIKVTKR